MHECAISLVVTHNLHVCVVITDDFSSRSASKTSTTTQNASGAVTPAPTSLSTLPAKSNAESETKTSTSVSTSSVVRDRVTPTSKCTSPIIGTVIPVSTTTDTSIPLLLLKNSDSIVIATGRQLEGEEVHGSKLRSGCCKVAISSILQSGSKAWYPDKFGEDLLEKGAIVEWPLNYTTFAENISPMTTRAKRMRKV